MMKAMMPKEMVYPIGKWRRAAGSTVMLLVFAASALSLKWHRSQQIVVTLIAPVSPADGREHAVLRVTRADGGRVDANEATAEGIAGPGGHGLGNFQIRQSGKEVEVWVKAPVMAKESQVRVQWGRRTVVGKVRFAQDDVDSFGDGMPDAL